MTIEVVHVKQVWMALPDVVMVLVRDQEVVFYPPVELGSPDAGTLGSNYQRTNPHTGGTEWARLTSSDKLWLKFGDKFPTAFASRTALDNPSNWSAIGARTVTAVHRKSRPFDQALGLTAISSTNRTATMEHYCYLQLNGNLAEGGPYDIACTGAGFTATTFTFNDDTTRAECIHTTQVGHRPGDSYKIGAGSLWIPGYGTEGQVDLITELGSAAFEVINAGNTVVHSGTFTLKTAPTDSPEVLLRNKSWAISSADAGTDVITVASGLYEGDRVIAKNHTGTLPTGLSDGTVYFIHKTASTTGTLHTTAADAIAATSPVNITATGTGVLVKHYEYPSTTVAAKVIEAITAANPAVFTITGHGYSVGQLLFPKRIAGMTQLESAILRVLSVTTDTFTCQISTSSVWSTLSTASGYSAFSTTGIYPANNNEMVSGHYANQAATYTYEFDYSALTTAGTYRVRIPGLGVGDPFTIHQGRYHTVLKTMVKGLYNQLTGYALDSNIGGVSRPVTMKDGANSYNNVYACLLPAWWSSEQATASATIASGESVNAATWYRAETTMGTATRVTGFFGGWSDAGDIDWHLNRHAAGIYQLLEYGYRKLPTASRDIKAGFPNLAALLDSTTYAGTSAIGDAVAMSLVYFDCLRVHQNVDGRVYSGLAYGESGTGINQNPLEPTYLGRWPGVLHAADPISNFNFAALAAKASQIFTLNGFTTLAATWKTSAELAYDWADDLYQDYITNGATGSLVQAYFVTKLNMKANASWSDATFATQMASIFSTSNCATAKKWAAGVLMNINGASSIYESYINGLGDRVIGETDPVEKFAAWEYGEAAVPPARQVDKDYYTGRRVSAAFTQNIVNLTSPSTIKSNNSYHFMNNSDSLWQGGANTFLYQGLIQEAAADPQTSTFYKFLQAGLAAQFGANQQNLCCTVGLGQRNPVTLHVERQAMGLKTEEWPGVTCYTWWNGNNAGVAVNNIATNDSTANFTQVVSITTPHKVIEPDYRSYGAFENNWGNTNFIFHAEFVTQSSIVGPFIVAAYLHAFDGNALTETITAMASLQFRF